jgi:ferredoxin
VLGVNTNKRPAAANFALKKMAIAQKRHHTYYKTEVGVFFGDDDDTTGGKRYADPYFDGEGPDRCSCIGCGSCMTGCIHDAKNSLDKNYPYLAEKKDAKTLLHCQVNARATTFSFLYRVIYDGVSAEEVKRDMNTVWQPNEVWRDFIFAALESYGKSVDECESCDWTPPQRYSTRQALVRGSELV